MVEFSSRRASVGCLQQDGCPGCRGQVVQLARRRYAHRPVAGGWRGHVLYGGFELPPLEHFQRCWRGRVRPSRGSAPGFAAAQRECPNRDLADIVDMVFKHRTTAWHPGCGAMQRWRPRAWGSQQMILGKSSIEVGRDLRQPASTQGIQSQGLAMQVGSDGRQQARAGLKVAAWVLRQFKRGP